nr:TetR/AcrR family transcriptional regulator [Kineosporia mesophila]
MLLFWKQGYEGASLTELEAAMGITRKSMYAAFGNKEELFLKALQRYTVGPAAYSFESLRQPTARQVATMFLAGSVRSSTWPGGPAGCMGVQGALSTGEAGRVVRDTLAVWRDGGRAALLDRFRQSVDEGDLPPTSDPEVLARYVMTVANGIAVQAAGGATREELQQVADAALKSWPPA